MTTLSRAQINFLEEQGIPLSRVFDATGLPRKAYMNALGELEMVIATGVTPCSAAKHTLRTRAGHCAQCNTHAIAFLLRHDDPGEVYVAHSPRMGLVKVGTSKSSHSRMANLNSYGYGGASDWSVRFNRSCAKAGRVEFAAQRKLDEFRVTSTYVKTGLTVACHELFECSVEKASEAVRDALSDAR